MEVNVRTKIRRGPQLRRTDAGGSLQDILDEEVQRHECLHSSADRSASDRHIVVDLENDASPRLWLAVLSGLTLTVLPAVGTDRFTIRARVMQDGRVRAEKTWKQKHHFVVQLFLVFGMPAAFPLKVLARRWHELAAQVADLAAATIDPPAPPPVPPPEPVPPPPAPPKKKASKTKRAPR